MEVAKLDKIDRTLLKILQKDSRVPLQVIAKRLGIPKSTVHYRISRLEREKVIEGYYAKLNPARLGYDYLAVVLVRAKYGPRYHQKVGLRLSKIPGVWAVYYVLGDVDFIVLIRALDRDDYMQKLERLSNMSDIERTSTQVVARILKEDPRMET
ncbi:MAG: Lrp/AsnC family transcriptional regulator [Candidatus Bathyarchaeia archaeon]